MSISPENFDIAASTAKYQDNGDRLCPSLMQMAKIGAT